MSSDCVASRSGGQAWSGLRAKRAPARYHFALADVAAADLEAFNVTAESQYARFGSGKSVPRVEDEALLTGAGRFVDDFSAPGQAWVSFLRSPHAHARIEAIDRRAAEGLPGVLAIVTGDDLVRDGVRPLPLSADFKRADGSPTASPPRHALAVDAVRFVGEAVAAVIAQTPQQARDAAEAIDVRYQPLSLIHI